MTYFKQKSDFATIEEVLDITGSTLKIDSSEVLKKKILGIQSLLQADENQITFFSNQKYIEDCKTTKALACLITKENAKYLNPDTIAVISSDPYLAFAKLMQHFYGVEEIPFKQECNIHPSASVSPSAKIGKNVKIYNNVVISEGAEIADDVTILPNVFIGSLVKIGKRTVIHDNSSIMFAEIGEDCVIRSGVRVGTAGFGFAPNIKTGQHVYIPQVAGVKIGNFVDVGANSAIDRGCLEDTVIKDYVKIDNLVQIGHGAKIGRSSFLAGMSGVSGSAIIGDGCFIGPQSGILGHIKVSKGTTVIGRTGLIEDVTKEGQILAGYPAISFFSWKRAHIKLMKFLK